MYKNCAQPFHVQCAVSHADYFLQFFDEQLDGLAGTSAPLLMFFLGLV